MDNIEEQPKEILGWPKGECIYEPCDKCVSKKECIKEEKCYSSLQHRGNKVALHYHPGKRYLVKGRIGLMYGWQKCETDDGEESCWLCPGKIVIGFGGTDKDSVQVMCGWGYNKNNKDWEYMYKEVI